jgi:excisionase family DNA binding protein
MIEQTLTESGTGDALWASGIADVAKRLSVSPGLIRLEIARGALRPLRLGRRVLISRRELERYLAQRSDNQAAVRS